MNPPTREPRHVSEILPEAFRDIRAALTPRLGMYDPQSHIDHFAADERTPDEILMAMEEHLDDADDEPDGLDLGGIRDIPPDALAVLLRYLLPASASITAPTFWKQVDLRIAAIAWSILPEFRQFSQDFIAESLGRTRAALSHHIVAIRDVSGIDCHGGKCQSARKILSKAQRRSWRKRHQADGAADGEHEGENQLDRSTELETIFAD